MDADTQWKWLYQRGGVYVFCRDLVIRMPVLHTKGASEAFHLLCVISLLSPCFCTHHCTFPPESSHYAFSVVISHQTLAACSSCQLHFPNRTNPKTANKRCFWVWKVKPAWKCPKLTLFVMINRGRLLRFEKDVCLYEIDGKKSLFSFNLTFPRIC